MAKHTYLTLDGIRGVAAILIVARHAPLYFGGFAPTDNFLAVDLFFVLSGFVLAHAYGRKLDAGLSTWEFMKTRAIRLYPLYLAGVVLGAVAVAIAIKTGFGKLDASAFPYAVATALTGLPALPLFGIEDLYPINPVHWSLFFEMLANLAMVLLWPRLTGRMLAMICAVSGVGLVIALPYLGTGDAGFEWPTFAVGFARVGFSFFAGLGLYRIKDRFSFSVPPLVALAIAAAILSYSPSDALRPYYDLACILLAFPALVLAASKAEPSRLAPAFAFIGATSYGVYAIHQPFQRLMRGVLEKLGVRIADLAPASGLGLVVALLVACWLLNRLYDAPLRRWLTATLAAIRPLTLRWRDERAG